MRNTYLVNEGINNGTSITFKIAEKIDETVVASGKMITHSDAVAFVYLVEQQGEYSYVQFPKDVWSLLAESLKLTEAPILIIGDLQVQLIDFQQELEMLLWNIEGNDNYGDSFTKAVESHFESFYSVQ